MRQITEEGWKRSGWLFGVISPVLCIVLDPGLFKSSSLDQPWFPSATGFFYSATLVSMAALGIALVRPHTPPLCRGILLFAALLASAMSLLLVPFAALLLVSGAVTVLEGRPQPFIALVPFGFIPVATATVYWRFFLCAEKPDTVAKSVLSLVGTALAFLLPVGVSIGAGAAASPCMVRVLGAPTEASASDLSCLQRLAFTTDFSPFVRAYWSADPAGQEGLRKVYAEITGRDLERDAILSD